jgi:coenzyme F420-reducing hydrogenase gamma subunit
MKPRLGVFKFASCDGCQLQILNAEDALLDLASVVEIAWFPEARSQQSPGPYDIGLVEGSITTPHDVERLREIRQQVGFLVAIGACATSGGIQALRNRADVGEYARTVYPKPEWLSTLPCSTPIAAHVPVDFELPGCPIDKRQLLGVLRALLFGTRPQLPTHSVCLDCKRSGAACVIVSRGEPCLGPVTSTGCGAICPRMGRGCYGCFGPAAGANLAALVALLDAQGCSRADTVRRLRGFTANAPAFREASDAIEG